MGSRREATVSRQRSGNRPWLSRFFRRMKPDEVQVSSTGKITAVYTDKSELQELVTIERERLEIDRELLHIEQERLTFEQLDADKRHGNSRNWAS